MAVVRKHLFSEVQSHDLSDMWLDPSKRTKFIESQFFSNRKIMGLFYCGGRRKVLRPLRPPRPQRPGIWIFFNNFCWGCIPVRGVILWDSKWGEVLGDALSRKYVFQKTDFAYSVELSGIDWKNPIIADHHWWMARIEVFRLIRVGSFG